MRVFTPWSVRNHPCLFFSSGESSHHGLSETVLVCLLAQAWGSSHNDLKWECGESVRAHRSSCGWFPMDCNRSCISLCLAFSLWCQCYIEGFGDGSIVALPAVIAGLDLDGEFKRTHWCAVESNCYVVGSLGPDSFVIGSLHGCFVFYDRQFTWLFCVLW